MQDAGGRGAPAAGWPMSADPAWLCALAPAARLLGVPGGAPPALLLAARAPAPPPAWPPPADPLPPLPLPLPARPCPLLRAQWLFGGPPPALGLAPSSTVELVPVVPHLWPPALPLPAGKSWTGKRAPSYKIFFNNSFALDSTWIYPEDSRLFHGLDKCHLLANQAAVTLSCPAPVLAPRPLTAAVVLTPQSLRGGCLESLKLAGRGPAMAIATTAAAMVSLSPERLGGPAPLSLQPCRLLTLAPLTLPLRPVLHSGRGRAGIRATRPPTLVLHAERTGSPGTPRDKERPAILVAQENSSPSGSRPVASTPVPGSPWCVVWTGDDRVFFFNPSLQLSVWERPSDLRQRSDLSRILEDPPHKRKLEATAVDSGDGSGSEDPQEDSTVKTKRNRVESSSGQSPEAEEAASWDGDPRTPPPPQIPRPLEERATHFRDMLLERGVSAFSTWEKELHKIVFDPRYLLLNSDERKQVFEQFVKTRVREEHRERRSRLLLARDAFRKLLEEAKVSSRTTFKEFAEKHGHDQRFRRVERRKDQELLFKQFILLLRRRHKAGRPRLHRGT